MPVGTKRHTGHGAGVAGSGRPRPGWAGSVRFHNRTVSSALPEARVCPSGLNATLSTALVCTGQRGPSGPGWAGSVRSHNRTVCIVAAGGQGVPVGTERDTFHGVGVAGQRLAQRARVGRIGEIPQPHACDRCCRRPGCARRG